MPIISNVGRKNIKIKLTLITIYTVLLIGAVSMIYPFTMMISMSFKSYADFQNFNIIPQYWHDSRMLYKKYIVDKVKTIYLGYQYGKKWYRPDDIKVSGNNDALKEIFEKKQPYLDKIYSDYLEFFETCPDLYKFSCFSHSTKMNYSVLDIKPQYYKWLKNKYKTVDAVNDAYTDNAKEFNEITLPVENPIRQRWLLPLTKKFKDWNEFKKTLPIGKIWLISADLAFQKYIREIYPGCDDIKNATKGVISSTNELNFVEAFRNKLLPEKELSLFIKRKCPVIFLRLDDSLKGKFDSFIKNKYLNYRNRPDASKVFFTEYCPMDDSYSGRANDWIEFLEREASVDKIYFCDPLLFYQKFLKSKYGNIRTVNNLYQESYKSFEAINLPAKWVDLMSFRKEQTTIFWKYLTGNYKMVLGVIAVHGRAFLNTVIYVILAIGIALTVNPLAAYALSRYRLPYTNKILLFLLATMAFPPSVGMIPGFLLLKDLNLLNTFAALLVPVLANGYGIFLLKGFFDSLPQELYEAAIIDGASELTVFYRIAVPLTKPILAIMALQAFTTAYSAFMFAFLTCQDPKMWTLMVFLYEFQQMYPTYLVMASLVVGAVPTLVVFLLCQKVILRGIIVPTMK